MNKENSRKMWRRILESIICGKGAECLKNPTLEFSVPGAHNDLTDRQYSDMIHNYMEQSQVLWRGKYEKTAAELLLDALSSTRITDECLNKIIEPLAEASEKTFYCVNPNAEFDKDIADELPVEIKADDIPSAFADFTPKEIEAWLRKGGGIVGQNAAVKAASMIVYNHLKGRTSVNLFAAPTGSGKTHLWRMLQEECCDNTIVIHDASSLTAEGWKGSNKISTIFKDIPAERRGHIILVLDEFDKLLEPQYGASGTNYSDIVQNQLLKLCDHDTLFFGNENGAGFSVDASGISIVLLGAFQRLMEKKSQSSGSIGFGGRSYSHCGYDNSAITVEDLIEYGMREELVGRITRITCMEPLSSDDLVSIGLNEVKKLESDTGLMLKIEYAKLAELAIEAKEKGLGARWLKSTIGNMLDELIYNDPNALGYTLGCRYFDSEEAQTDECME